MVKNRQMYTKTLHGPALGSVLAFAPFLHLGPVVGRLEPVVPWNLAIHSPGQGVLIEKRQNSGTTGLPCTERIFQPL